MSSCGELPGAAETALSCPSSSDLQVDMSSSTLVLLATADLPSSSQATTALHLERYASELSLWLQRSDAASAADDALFFFETKHPELLDDLPLLFAWLSLFLAQHEAARVAANSSTDSCRAPIEAVQQLDGGADMAAVAQQFALKSALTLLYWKHEAERQAQRADEAENDVGRPSRPVGFQDKKGLLQWLVAHREVPLTRQDVINHVAEQYPVFAASKSAAALKVWTARFLKKHIPRQSMLAPAPAPELAVDVSAVAIEQQVMEVQTQETRNEAVEPPESPTPLLLPQSKTLAEQVPAEEETPMDQHTGKRRSCSGRYMLFSNEFKLHALNMLDEGKSTAEVAGELGLKNPNCLNYWRSIRDKLMTSEKKRFRLEGGGRRSSCVFEDELLTWVSERHQRGEGIDVDSVLEYMRQYHASFTTGKKESTLRKWILRFFKRCWRAPSTSMDSQDAEKSYIFV